MDFYGKPLNLDWLAKVVFRIHILLIFVGHCNRYFWNIWLKNYRLSNFDMLFLVPTKIIFPKWIVFVFTKSWSRDQLLQKAYPYRCFWFRLGITVVPREIKDNASTKFCRQTRFNMGDEQMANWLFGNSLLGYGLAFGSSQSQHGI